MCRLHNNGFPTELIVWILLKIFRDHKYSKSLQCISILKHSDDIMMSMEYIKETQVVKN